MRPPMPAVRLSRRARVTLAVVAVLIVLLILLSSLSGYYLDYEWFGEVGQRGVFTGVLVTRLVLFAIFGVLMALIIGTNLIVAYRLRPPFRPMSPEQQNLERYRTRVEPRRKLLLGVLAGLFGVGAGLSVQGGWQTWSLWLHGGSFGFTDAQFGKDISFYAWDYPIYRVLLGFGFTAIIFSLIASVVVHYVFGAVRLQTPGPKVTLAARRHLSVLVFVFVLLKAIAYWLDRYGLVFSDRGKITGASYTDVNAGLPAKTILFYVAIVIAIGVLASMWLRSTLVPVVAFATLLVLAVLANGIYPAIVQQFRVNPNANNLEATYISRNIAATREAYNVITNTGTASAPNGSVTYSQYQASTNPDPAAVIDQSNPTISNIRVLDPNILSPTFARQQNIRQFYGFNDKLDIDRYSTDTSGTQTTRDYIVAVRELKQSLLQGDQTNWINNYTRYTHGYGFVAAAASSDVTTNRNYAEGNIPPTGFLSLSQPRVYFGEDMPDYSVVGAQGRNAEYDATGDSFTYTGSGGVSLSSLVNRLAFAVHYKELSFLLNDVASAKGAKVIFDRDPRARVEKVAPFLKVDGDPYPTVVGGRMVWLVDGYTTMSNYPYSERQALGAITADTLTATNRSAALPNEDINYIRNSVKATVDAYTGAVTLYQWDKQDPVLKAWMKTFPGLVKPVSKMPTEVVDHVRYPEDLFNVQRSILQRYHVDDPRTFYSSASQWTVPTDPTYTGTNKPNQPAYYVQASDPAGSATSQFQLTSPMNVQGRPNLAAYVSVDSTPGNDYGKITVLQVPPGVVVKAPEQAQADFIANAVIANDLNRLRSGESSIQYGNLLTLPVGNSFLYVEPLYVQASGDNGFPQLQRVLVAYGDRIGYAPTLAGALADLTTGQTGSSLGDVNNATNNPGPNPSASASPSTSASASPTATPSTPVATGTGSQAQVDAVLVQIQAASVALQNAYKSGDFAAAGQAQAQLSSLVNQYLQLRGASGSATASASPSGS